MKKRLSQYPLCHASLTIQNVVSTPSSFTVTAIQNKHREQVCSKRSARTSQTGGGEDIGLWAYTGSRHAATTPAVNGFG